MIYFCAVLLFLNFVLNCVVIYQVNNAFKNVLGVALVGLLLSGVGVVFLINHVTMTPEMVYLKCIKNIPDHKKHCEKYLNELK